MVGAGRSGASLRWPGLWSRVQGPKSLNARTRLRVRDGGWFAGPEVASIPDAWIEHRSRAVEVDDQALP